MAVEVKLSGRQGELYTQFAEGVRYLKSYTFSSPYYPKGAGLFYPPEFDSNLSLLDDRFYRGAVAVAVEGLKKLLRGETPEEERKLLSTACSIFRKVVSNPKVFSLTEDEKESYERIRERTAEVRESSYDFKEVKPAEGRSYEVRLLKGAEKGELYSAGMITADRPELSQDERFALYLGTLRPLLTEELFEAFKEFYFEFGGLSCFGYLKNRAFPFGLLYVAGEEKRYYFIKPQNYWKRKKSFDEIWETAEKIEKENGEEGALLEEHRIFYRQLLEKVKDYYKKGEFRKRLEKTAEKGMQTLEGGVFFADSYERGETAGTYTVVEKGGADGKGVILTLSRRKRGKKDVPVLYLFPVGKEKVRRGDFRQGVEPDFIFSALVLAGALFVWSREENIKYLIVHTEKEGYLEVFYKLLRGFLYSLPPFPFQTVTDLKLLSNSFALSNIRLSSTKKTRRITVKTSLAVPDAEGYVIKEEPSDYLLPLLDTAVEDSPYHGLSEADLTALRYTVYRFRAEGGEISLSVMGTGVRLPWGEFVYEGEKPRLSEKPSVLLTELRGKRDVCSFLGNLFGEDKPFGDKLLEVKTFSLALVHTKAETITEGFLLYREQMNALRSVVKEALGVGDSGFLFAVFPPMTPAQKGIIRKAEFVTGTGTAFYGELSPSYWAENGRLLWPLFTVLSMYETEAVNRGISKLKDRGSLKRLSLEIKRGRDSFLFGADYLTAEGTARLLKALEGEK